MHVETLEFVFTLYVGVRADNVATWVMHVYRKHPGGCESWLDTFLDVSTYNPFLSGVTYDAWR